MTTRTAVAVSLLLLASVAALPARRSDGLTIAVRARALQPGEVALLTIAAPQPLTRVRARAFDHALAAYAVDATTWRVLAGIDLDVAPGPHDIAIDADTAAGALQATDTLVVQPKTFPTRTLTVDEAFVNPPASVTTRIQTEAAALDRFWTRPTSARLWTDGFVLPVADPANSAFGSRSVFNGQARSPHAGADFLSPAGTPVKAPAAGRVVLARNLYYTGNTVVVDHGLGLLSLFAHFSAIDVHAGDAVVAGQVLGRVGATGRVTGPHLHWAVRLNDARVDPLSLLAVLGRD